MAARNYSATNNRRYGEYFHFILHGDRGVGKTSLLEAYMNGRPNVRFTDRIMFNEFVEPGTINGQPCNVVLMENCQMGDKYKPYQRPPSFQGIILLFAYDDPDSFRNLAANRDELLRHVYVKNVSPFPCIVLANKCDIPEDARRVRNDELQTWCSDYGVNIFEISNRQDDVHIMHQAIYELVGLTIAYEAAVERSARPPLELNPENAENRNADCLSCCCLW